MSPKRSRVYGLVLLVLVGSHVTQAVYYTRLAVAAMEPPMPPLRFVGVLADDDAGDQGDDDAAEVPSHAG